MTPSSTALEQLRDIHLPAPVAWWPPAPGWWITAALLVLLIAILAIRGYRRHQQQAFRRAALQECQQLRKRLAQGEAPQRIAQDLAQLLRRVARVIAPGQPAIGQCGDEWLKFLDATGCTGEFTRGAGRALAEWPYQPPAALDIAHAQAKASDLLRLAETWLRRVERQAEVRP